MRIVRSKGVSFTRRAQSLAGGVVSGLAGMDQGMSAAPLSSAARLFRGVWVNSARVKHPELKGPLVEGGDVAALLEQDPDFLMRSLAKILDTVVPKPRSMKLCDLNTYVARTLLGKALFDRFLDKFVLDGPEKKSSEQRWKAKVHPYAADMNVDWRNPRSDPNGKVIAARRSPRNDEAPVVPRRRSRDRWRLALGKVAEVESMDYNAVAAAIFQHLLEQEQRIHRGRHSQNDRLKGGSPSKTGLLASQAHAIVNNATDPREESKKKIEFGTWDERSWNFYFQHQDIASELYRKVTQEHQNIEPTRNWFGKQFYNHFGTIAPHLPTDTGERQKVWNLHNRVREFYGDLARSERFRIAVRLKDWKKLKELFPASKSELHQRLEAGDRNRYIARRIRTGKIIAHAVDLCADQKPELIDGMFKSAMDYFATSVGQADIKRNEAFVRVWRSAVALSLRTMRPWADPERKVAKTNADKADYDLSGTGVAAEAVYQLDVEAFLGHVPLIFGGKPYRVNLGTNGGKFEERSRSSLVLDGDKTDLQETLWCFLRLAGEVRNATVHFNTKRRLLDTLFDEPILKQHEKGLLWADAAQAMPPGNQAHGPALARIGRLLSFDWQVEAQVLADTLNALSWASYVSPAQRKSILDALWQGQDGDSYVTPKFMAVLQKGRALAEDAAEDSPLLSYKKLNLHALSKEREGGHKACVGLLRLLYDRAFSAWLAEKETNPELLDTLKAVLRAKRDRRKVYAEEAKRPALEWEEGMADALLSEATSLSELVDTLAVEAMIHREKADGEDRPDPKPSGQQKLDQYRPDKDRQRAESNAVEELRREVFANLFAQFIEGEGLKWLWCLSGVVPNDSASSVRPEEFPAREDKWTEEDRQIYAWLYLVPVDQVALLRHQVRKTQVLERKAMRDRATILEGRISPEILALTDAGPTIDDKLRKLDRLMGLYARVQSAGFDGKEHLSRFRDGNIFYAANRNAVPGSHSAEPSLFEKVFSDAAEYHMVSVPGTRRGLRQMLRFDTLPALRQIIGNHKVTEDEVRIFTQVIADGDTSQFSRREELRKQIVDLNNKDGKEEGRETALVSLCEEYRKCAVNTLRYDFSIAGARLTEFANLHHLLMRILARLTDFTAVWERDRLYYLLGLVHDRNPGLAIRRVGESRIELILPGEPERKIPLLHRRSGFKDAHLHLLGLDHGRDEARMISRYFGELDGHVRRENPKDVQVRTERNRLLKPADAKMAIKPATGYRFGLARIRNDLAHFNIIDTKPVSAGRDGTQEPMAVRSDGDINLSYIVNAVRSLMSYDRKLKNAVPKAIIDIVAEAGIELIWKFDRDRLTHARLRPAVLKHLHFVRSGKKVDVTFALPRVSGRFLSMTKALFDFGSQGYWKQYQGVRSNLPHAFRYPMDEVFAAEWLSAKRLPVELARLAAEAAAAIRAGAGQGGPPRAGGKAGRQNGGQAPRSGGRPRESGSDQRK